MSNDMLGIKIRSILNGDDIDAQIKALSTKIKERLELKLKINATDLQVLTKQVDDVQKKIKAKTFTNDSLFINDKVEQQAFSNITSRLREVKKNVDELATVKSQYSIDAEGKNKLETATLSYYNKELGQTVTETMRWVEAEKMVNGEKQKTRTFRSVSTDVTDDMAKARKEAEKYTQSLKDLSLYKQKLLGGNGFTGEIDIFADKQKGNYDKNALAKIRSEVQGLNKDTPDLQNKIKQLGVEFSSLKQKSAQSGSVMARAFEGAAKFLRFYLVGGLLVSGVNAIKNSITFVTEMNTALVSLNKVVNFSKSELDEMSNSAIKLGKELGKSSVEIMRGMAEFGRITKSKEEIIELTKVATMASNVTEMTADSAAKAITSTMVTFGIQAKDSMKILDSWNELQNNFRVSAEDLASAIGKVGAASKVAKTDMQTLEGQVTAIIQATGVSGDEAGTAMKSFMSRIYRTDESDPEQLGKTAEALKSIADISVEGENGLKPFGQLIDEIAGKWTGLNESQKMALSQSIGSTYHYSKFIALMDNYKIALDATSKAYESFGSATSENIKQLESISGQLGILKVNFQGLAKTLISDDFLITTLVNLNEVLQNIEDTLNRTSKINLSSIWGFIKTAATTSLPELIKKSKNSKEELISKNSIEGMKKYSELVSELKTELNSVNDIKSDNISKIQNEFLKLGYSALETDNIIKDVSIGIQKSNGDIATSTSIFDRQVYTVDKLNKSYETTTKSVDDFQSTIKDVSSVYEQLNDNEKISADTLLDLIQKYPEYATQIANINGSKEDAISLTNILFEIEKQRTIAKLENDKKELESEIGKIEAIKKAYETQAYESYLKFASDDSESIDTLKAEQRYAKALTKGNSNNEEANLINEKVNALNNAIGILRNASLPDFSSTKGGSGGGADKNADKYKLEKDRYMSLTQSYNDANNALELNNSLMENASDSDKLKYLDERIILYQNLSKAINDTTWEQQQEANELQEYMKLQGVQFDGNNIIAQSYDDIIDARVAYINSLESGDERTAAIQEVENLKKNAESYESLISDKIPKGYRDILKTTGDINKAEADKLDILEKQKKEIEKQIETAQKYLEDSLKFKADAESANEDLYESAIDVLEKEANARKQNLDDQKYNLEQGQKALEESIDLQSKSWEEYYDNQKDKYEDDFDSYKQFVEDKYDTEIENLNRQKELLSRSFDDQKYNRDQEERRQKLSKLEAKYNIISTDNSGMMEKEKLDLFNEISEARKEISENEQEYIFKNQQNQTDDVVDLKQREKDNLIRYAEENKNAQVKSIEATKNAQLKALESMRDAQGKTVEDYKKGLAEIEASLRALELEERGFADRASAIMSQPFNSIKSFFDEYITKAKLSVTETEKLIKSIEDLYNTSKNSVQSSIQSAMAGIIAAKEAWLSATTDEQRKAAEKVATDIRTANPDVNNIPGMGADDTLPISQQAQQKYNSSNSGYGGAISGSEQEAQNLEKIATDKSYVDSEIERAKAVIDYRKANQMDTSEQEEYLDYLEQNKYHDGGFVGGKALDKNHEQVAKVLTGELMLPPKQLDGLANNFLPMLKNIQNLILPQFSVPKLPPLATSGGTSQPINLSINMGGVSLANDMDVDRVGESLGNKIVNKLKWSGLGGNIVRAR